jgi:hypothetical protein
VLSAALISGSPRCKLSRTRATWAVSTVKSCGWSSRRSRSSLARRSWLERCAVATTLCAELRPNDTRVLVVTVRRMLVMLFSREHRGYRRGRLDPGVDGTRRAACRFRFVDVPSCTRVGISRLNRTSRRSARLT